MKFVVYREIEDFIWVIHGSFHTIRERNLKRIIPDHTCTLAPYKCAKGKPLVEITCNLACTPQY